MGFADQFRRVRTHCSYPNERRCLHPRVISCKISNTRVYLHLTNAVTYVPCSNSLVGEKILRLHLPAGIRGFNLALSVEFQRACPL